MAAVKKKARSPFHPEEQAKILREPKPPSALMEFIMSLDGEVEYAEALREYQNEWCEHAKEEQEVISTLYLISEGRYIHELRCDECGIIRQRSGRASVHRS